MIGVGGDIHESVEQVDKTVEAEVDELQTRMAGVQQKVDTIIATLKVSD